MGNAWLELGDVVKAQQFLDQSRDLYARAQVGLSVKMADCILGLARLHIRAGRGAEAETMLLLLVRSWKDANPNSEWHGEALYWLSQAQSSLGKTREANENRNASIVMLKKTNLPALQRLLASK
jgi:hypothetical protein